MSEKVHPYLKKNCLNCKHLQYYSKECYEDSASEGYYCEGQRNDYGPGEEENKHLAQLDTPSYREKAKVCHELRDDDYFTKNILPLAQKGKNI